MLISRTVRIVAACALTVLGAFGVAGVLHGSEGHARALDTTWNQPIDGSDVGADVPVNTLMDTTW